MCLRIYIQYQRWFACVSQSLSLSLSHLEVRCDLSIRHEYWLFIYCFHSFHLRILFRWWFDFGGIIFNNNLFTFSSIPIVVIKKEKKTIVRPIRKLYVSYTPSAFMFRSCLPGLSFHTYMHHTAKQINIICR